MQVGRFDIAVHDIQTVQCAQTFRQTYADAADIGGGEVLAAVQLLLQRRSGVPVHYVIKIAATFGLDGLHLRASPAN